MYQVFCDANILYDPRLPDVQVIDPTLVQKKNEPGELTFGIPKSHTGYSGIEKLKSRVKVYRDGTLIWMGRILQDERDLYETKQVSAEGALGFLLDSIIRPFEFDGSPADLLAQIVASHNAQVNENQRFIMGNVTVTGVIHRSSVDYLSAWQTISTRLLDELGGYLLVRFDDQPGPCSDAGSDRRR